MTGELDAESFPQDRSDFLAAIKQKATLMRQGAERGRQVEANGAVDGLLFAGMGFSGITAELVRDAASRNMTVPIIIVKHYQHPNFVGPGWKTIACSYSGATEETLSVAKASKSRGVPITAFTTGGPLADMADVHVSQPAGFQPRAALAYCWFSVLGYLEATGILDAAVPVEEAAAAVEAVDAAYGPHVPESENLAKQLARRLMGPIPRIYATPAFLGVAMEFKGMLNENAKKIVSVDLVPECNHNDLTAWGEDLNRGHFTVLTLSHGDQNPELQRRLSYMRQRYESWGVHWEDLRAQPIKDFRDHVIEQARMIQFLDYTAYYVAILRGKDPSEIPEIKGLKAFLRGE